MTEKAEFEHVEPEKANDILGTEGMEALSPAEDKRLLRRIDMW